MCLFVIFYVKKLTATNNNWFKKKDTITNLNLNKEASQIEHKMNLYYISMLYI